MTEVKSLPCSRSHVDDEQLNMVPYLMFRILKKLMRPVFLFCLKCHLYIYSIFTKCIYSVNCLEQKKTKCEGPHQYVQ